MDLLRVKFDDMVNQMESQRMIQVPNQHKSLCPNRRLFDEKQIKSVFFKIIQKLHKCHAYQ